MKARFALALLLCAPLPCAAPAAFAQEGAPRPQTDLDTFMARVLERRDENWKKLHDYILSESERFSLTGPGKASLYGFRREFSWYVRDGILVRSPVRYDGVTIPEPERRRYEERWLKEEQEREARRSKEKADKGAASPAAATEVDLASQGAASLEAIVSGRVEPRFVSEAYFLTFKFEPGNYFLVGREQIDGRDVLRIEYYPTHLFPDDEHRKEAEKPGAKPDKNAEKERQMEDRIQRNLNKTSLVTLWVEPNEFQIVRYVFDNVDFGFLPARWLVRIDEVKASMTMGKVLDGVWLPRAITMQAGFSLASGGYQFEYGREFYDHRKAEVSARIRSIRDKER
jgi:hypothetical protein